MSHQYHFLVEDVTCEKCDARIRQALLALPGTQQVELTCTPNNEATVVLTTAEDLPTTQIETTIVRYPMAKARGPRMAQFLDGAISRNHASI